MNENLPRTIICPITTRIQMEADLLRIHQKNGETGLEHGSDIIVDQIHSIENQRTFADQPANCDP